MPSPPAAFLPLAASVVPPAPGQAFTAAAPALGTGEMLPSISHVPRRTVPGVCRCTCSLICVMTPISHQYLTSRSLVSSTFQVRRQDGETEHKAELRHPGWNPRRRALPSPLSGLSPCAHGGYSSPGRKDHYFHFSEEHPSWGAQMGGGPRPSHHQLHFAGVETETPGDARAAPSAQASPWQDSTRPEVTSPSHCWSEAHLGRFTWAGLSHCVRQPGALSLP